MLPAPRWSYHLEAKRHGDILKKAAGRMRNIKMVGAWNKWWELVEERREKERKQNRWGSTMRT
jgi:hypothetical protein